MCDCDKYRRYDWSGYNDDQGKMHFEVKAQEDESKTLDLNLGAARVSIHGHTFALPEEAVFEFISQTTCENQLDFFERALQQARVKQLPCTHTTEPDSLTS